MKQEHGQVLNELRAICKDEIGAMGGELFDGKRGPYAGYIRGILPQVEDMRFEDGIKGGVAVRASNYELQVSPFLFRMICSNGAIVEKHLETRMIRFSWSGAQGSVPQAIETDLRLAIRACAGEEAFIKNAGKMRGTIGMGIESDLLHFVVTNMTRIEGSSRTQIDILDRGISGGMDRFELMNLITAHAREMADPAQKWQMESLGGSILSFGKPVEPPKNLSGSQSMPLGKEEKRPTY